MTYEQYWYGDPLMVRAYYKAEKLRKERMDESAWLHGMYVMNAIDATIGNAFRKSGTMPSKYPTEPVTLSGKQEQRKQTEEEKKNEATWALAWMSSFVQAGKNWGKNKAKEG